MKINTDKIIKEYQKAIDEIIGENGATAFIGESFGCYPKTKEIEIPMLMAESGADSFLVSVNITNIGNVNTNNFDILTWSLLHEIGHLESKQGDLFSKIGRKISNLLMKIGFKNLCYRIYYNLPEEKNATEWATDYVNLNYKKVKQLENNILNAYYDFFNELDIEI